MPCFATYTPQSYNAPGERMLHDFNALTDLLLRVHYDFDYLDEDILAGAAIEADGIRVADETYPLLILPPMTHLKIETLERLERFAAQGGRLMATTFLPSRAFGPDGQVDISARIKNLFGVDPHETQREYSQHTDIGLHLPRARGGRENCLPAKLRAGAQPAHANSERTGRAWPTGWALFSGRIWRRGNALLLHARR